MAHTNYRIRRKPAAAPAPAPAPVPAPTAETGATGEGKTDTAAKK
jgi:hypothetical protein